MAEINWADDSDVKYDGSYFDRAAMRLARLNEFEAKKRAKLASPSVAEADKNEGWAADDTCWPGVGRGIGR